MSGTAWWPLLFVAGVIASALGAAAGLGGAFIALPVLRLLGISPQWAATASLTMVLANSFGASLAYARQRRIDWLAGAGIAVTGIPAGVAGAYVLRFVNGRTFDLILAALEVTIAVYLLTGKKPAASLEAAQGDRVLTDAFGTRHVYRGGRITFLLLGLVVGFTSSFFGIGGGVVMVPVMVLALRMPPHIAAATSSFAILLTSPAGIVTHVALHRGVPPEVLSVIIALAAGGLIGGQAGARLAPKISGRGLTVLISVLLLGAAAALAGRQLHAL